LNIVTRFLSLITAAAALAACGGGDSPESAPANQSPAPGTIALAAATYAVNQSAGTVTLSVARTGGSDGAASVAYATSDGTGKAGTDYTATSGTLTWADGDAAAKPVALPVSAATGFSGTKTFSFTLSTVSGASLGSPASATVTINGSATSDDDETTAGALRFSASSYSAQQTAGTVTVTVNRTGGSAGAVSVQYATSNGTASAGTHYTAKTGTLNWAAGATAAQTISIPIATSPAFSGSKSFALTLSTPTGNATLGSPATSTVSIVGATPATLSVRVQGNHLIDAQGNTLQLRGVNTASLEFWPIQTSNADYWGGQKPNLDAIKAWGANTIRVPLNSTSYLGLTCYNLNDGSARKADPQSKYPAVVKEIVDAATARGLYVILDLHKNAPKGTVTGHTGKVQTCSISSTQQQMADADNSEAFWTAVATDFQGYPNVIFDLYNEPYFDGFVGVSSAADKWKALRDGGISNFYYASNQTVDEQTPTAGMQAMLNAVRATGATNVVMSAGISWAQDFSQWVQYKPNDPLGQLAMSWHAYPFYGATYGTAQYTQPGLGAVSYDWAQAALDAGFPIIIGETGDRSVNGTASAPFLDVLLPWADSHNVSVVGWGWNAWGENSANLIKDASGTPTDGYGVAFKAWLVNHP
jgi:aryl-phospho-beta-D-glucosidase BglC (GH1 family)